MSSEIHNSSAFILRLLSNKKESDMDNNQIEESQKGIDKKTKDSEKVANYSTTATEEYPDDDNTSDQNLPSHGEKKVAD